VDNVLFDISVLTDLILSQSIIGSTVKTDGAESDPFAFMTVLNLNEHRSHPAIRQIIDYIYLKTKKKEAFYAKLKYILEQESTHKVGLIVSERLINMPTEIVPPMYRMLCDEMKRSIDNVSTVCFSNI